MRVLLTGASGLFGANGLLQYAGRFELTVVCHGHPVRPDGWEVRRVDLTQRAEVLDLMAAVRPAVIIHAAAMTGVDACEEHPEAAAAVNAAGTEHVAHAARAVGASLVYLSTDYVFDGRKPGGRYTEEEVPHPLGVYARTKWEGERAAQAACPQTTIVRTTLYGWNAQPKQSFAERVLEGLAGGPPVTAFTDMYWSPILANDLADALLGVIEHPAAGIFHVAGRQRVSRYEFACAVAKAFGHDPSAVRPGRLAEAALTAPRPPDASLDVSKFERTFAHHLPTMQEGIARLRALQDDGVPARLRRLLVPAA